MQLIRKYRKGNPIFNIFFCFGLQKPENCINKSAVNKLEQDKYLLEGLAKQDNKAIESIYRFNYQMIQHLIINNKGSYEDAADIFQEAMVILYEKSIEPNFILDCQIKTYLYSVARRLWLKKLEKLKKRGTQVDEFDQIVAVEQDLEHHERENEGFKIMQNAMAKIGEPCKGLLEEFYINKKSMQEISALYNYTNADNAKTQKYKCLNRLKKLFFSEYKNL